MNHLKFSNLISVLAFCLSLMALGGCHKDVDDVVVPYLEFANATSHSVSVSIKGLTEQVNFGDDVSGIGVYDFASIDGIAPGESESIRVNKEPTFLILRCFSSITFTFDDGKAVAYERLNTANYDDHIGSPMRLESLSIGELKKQKGEFRGIFTYTITDKQYLEAK